MKLLHIDSSILGANSVSRQLTAETVQAWLAAHPDTEVMATGLLLVVTAAVLWRERQLFFGGPVRPRARRVASGRL